MTLFTLSFHSLFLLVSLHAGERSLDKTAVIVNQDVILESDIDRYRKKVTSPSYQQLFGGVPKEAIKDRTSTLHLLVDEKILHQQVRKLEMQASEQEVMGQIQSILRKNGISQAQLIDRLKQLGTNFEDYKDAIRKQIERKNLIDREFRPQLVSSDEQLKNFYFQNYSASDNDIQYKLAHILIAMKGSKEDSLKRAKKVLEIARSHPDQFSKWVKEYSDDSDTIENGGVLGTFSLSSLAKEFRETVPRLSIGAISDPLITPLGIHLLQVQEKSSPGFASLTSEQKEEMRTRMVAGEIEKKMAAWLEKKRAESYIKKWD